MLPLWKVSFAFLLHIHVLECTNMCLFVCTRDGKICRPNIRFYWFALLTENILFHKFVRLDLRLLEDSVTKGWKTLKQFSYFCFIKIVINLKNKTNKIISSPIGQIASFTIGSGSKFYSLRISNFVRLCSRVHLSDHPSLVQSFVGSLWIGRSRAALMSSTASYSMCIASPMWSYWLAMLMCMATCCPSTMTTTITRPSPLPALSSGCSCRGKVRTQVQVLVSTFTSQICFHVEIQTTLYWGLEPYIF